MYVNKDKMYCSLCKRCQKTGSRESLTSGQRQRRWVTPMPSDLRNFYSASIGSDTRLKTCSPRFESGNLPSLQWTAIPWMGCHLGWYSTVSCPLRGSRGEIINTKKGPLVHQKQIRKKKKNILWRQHFIVLIGFSLASLWALDLPDVCSNRFGSLDSSIITGQPSSGVPWTSEEMCNSRGYPIVEHVQ